MQFKELNLSKNIQRAIAEFGYTEPSPIQQKAIPPVLDGRDLIGCAQTGTGKTAAFALPMLELLSKGKPAKRGEVRSLILTPTRELALQIGKNFADYGKHTRIKHTVIFGGVGQMPQVEALKKGVDVLIACPGRLNDLTNQGHVNLSKLEIFVLDEADRMLDMGFVHDVKKVVAKLPAKRQSLMFSATMPKEIEALAKTFLTKPVAVKVDPVSSTVDRIEQSLYFVEKGNKLSLLIHLIKTLSINSALVFSRTKHGADKIAKQLIKAGITAAAIHGNKGQNARVSALENFKNGEIRILVATDIAARGIDINELSHVFNFDLPEVPETYVHRIGRTARAGADGIAIAFCASEEKEYLRGIEKLNRKQISVVSGHPFDGVPSPIKTVVQPLRGKKPKVEGVGKKSTSENSVKKNSKIQKNQEILIENSIKSEEEVPMPKQSGKNWKELRQNIRNDDAQETDGQEYRKQHNNRKTNKLFSKTQNQKLNQPKHQGGKVNNSQNSQVQNSQQRQNRQQAVRANNQNQGGLQQNTVRANTQPAFDPRFLTESSLSQMSPVASAPRQEAQNIQQTRKFQGGQRQERAQTAQNRQPRQQQNQQKPQRNPQQKPQQQNNVQKANVVLDAQKQQGGKNAQKQQVRTVSQANATRNAPQMNVQRTAAQTNVTRNAPRANTQRTNYQAPNTQRFNAVPREQKNYETQAPRKRNERTVDLGKQNSSGLRTVRLAKPLASNNKPGMELITRRPPKQKFGSFEDYMTSRGGESAPIIEPRENED